MPESKIDPKLRFPRTPPVAKKNLAILSRDLPYGLRAQQGELRLVMEMRDDEFDMGEL